jgi:hypothetical protein
MREARLCGRIGEVDDRELVTTALGEPTLECPDEACGHTDRLEWLPEDIRRLVVKEEARRGANAPTPGESVQIMRRKGEPHIRDPQFKGDDRSLASQQLRS